MTIFSSKNKSKKIRDFISPMVKILVEHGRGRGREQITIRHLDDPFEKFMGYANIQYVPYELTLLSARKWIGSGGRTIRFLLHVMQMVFLIMMAYREHD